MPVSSYGWVDTRVSTLCRLVRRAGTDGLAPRSRDCERLRGYNQAELDALLYSMEAGCWLHSGPVAAAWYQAARAAFCGSTR